MISEKITAGLETVGGLMTGGSPFAMVERYREQVTANGRRLGATNPHCGGKQALVQHERTGMLPTPHRRST
jgi:hypothetical protein